MTAEELSDCKSTAKILNTVSLLGLIVPVTLVIVFVLGEFIFVWQKLLLTALLFSGLLTCISVWHVRFDARLLNKLTNQTLTIEDVDRLLLQKFKKDMRHKSIATRIAGCLKLVTTFKLILSFHIALFLLHVLLFLIF